MSEINRYLWLRHLRSETSCHILRHRRGKLVASGRGLSFWFLPFNTSIAEIPVGDRVLPFLFHGRSKDFQDITVQGTVNYRVVAPETLGERLDFSIDLARGQLLRDPLDQLANLFTGYAQQIAVQNLARADVRELLAHGPGEIQHHLELGLRDAAVLAEMGLAIVSVQVSALKPTAEFEKALQTPARELVQQDADRATFERRALAVEKERAIAENELQNQIELARREKTLIEQRGANERERAREAAEAQRIEVHAQAEATRTDAEAQAERIRLVEGARVTADKERMEMYRGVPPSIVFGLAAQELAGKLNTIEHLNISPDMLGTGLVQLLEAGAARLKGG